MAYSPYTRFLGPRDEYGNLVLHPRSVSGGGSVNQSLEKPNFLRSTSYTSSFSSSTCGSSNYTSSPPTSSPSLGNLDSPDSENHDEFKMGTGLSSFEGIRRDFLEALPREGIDFAAGPPKVQPLRVVIIGSGIAGLCSAIACARQGFSVTVLERSTIRSNFGDSIVIGSNATLLLHRWGILDEMNEKATKGKWWIVNDDKGNELHREDLLQVSEKYGSPLLQGKRSQFTGIMDHEARRLGVDFRYDAEVTGYSDSQVQPGVMLRGGEMVRGDLIIVCDGAKSSARRLMADDESVLIPRQPSGYAIHRSIISSKDIKKDPHCSYLADGNIRFFLGENCHAEVWPLEAAGQIAFTFTHSDSKEASSLDWRRMTSISTCLKEMKDWDPTLLEAVRKFPVTHYWTILEDKVEPSWVSKGRKIVFAGDAVHPLAPASFQAGTQAVEDGATIALCLALSGATQDRVPLALKVYERLRSHRAEKAGELGRKQQEVLHSFVARDKPSDPNLRKADSAQTLRPLNFELFDFDAETFAASNFELLAKEIEIEEAKKPPSKGTFTSRYFAETF